jgi:hypothetical protein
MEIQVHHYITNTNGQTYWFVRVFRGGHWIGRFLLCADDDVKGRAVRGALFLFGLPLEPVTVIQ